MATTFNPIDPSVVDISSIAAGPMGTGLTLVPGSVSYQGVAGQASAFLGAGATLGIDSGLLLTSGSGTPAIRLDNFEFGTTERLFSKVMVDFTRVRFNNWRGRHRRHQGYRGRRHHGARIRRPGRPQWCPLLCLLAHRQRRGNGRPSVRLRTRTGTLASCFLEA